jgi:hypothetical protein
MRVSYDEGVASHVGPESCGGDREVVAEALTEEGASRVLDELKVTRGRTKGDANRYINRGPTPNYGSRHV